MKVVDKAINRGEMCQPKLWEGDNIYKLDYLNNFC